MGKTQDLGYLQAYLLDSSPL